MSKAKIWNSANIVTIIRICLVPLFIAVLLSPWPRWIDNSGGLDYIKPWVALVVFIVISATDSLDGYLARSKNQVTDFGKFLDPLADKILVASALIALVELSVLPTWVVVIILMREFIISGVRMLAAGQGQVIAASWYGKAKTVSQIIAIAMFILKEALRSSGAQSLENPMYITAWVVMIISLILTVVSMFDYLYKARYVIGFGNNSKNETVANLSARVIEKAKHNDLTIGTAESMTSGMVAASLAKVPGASEVFVGGVCSYAYSIKENLLGVDKKLLASKGAVNKQVALQMAQGGCSTLNCDVCVSVTGIAGPGSDEFNTKVGTVYLGISCNGKTHVKELSLHGERQQIRKQATLQALKLICEYI